MTTDAKVRRRLLKRAWGSSRPSLFLSGMSEMGPTNDMSIDTAAPAARDRSGVTLPVVSTCRRPHLTTGTSRCALPPFHIGRKPAKTWRAPNVGADG